MRGRCEVLVTTNKVSNMEGGEIEGIMDGGANKRVKGKFNLEEGGRSLKGHRVNDNTKIN